MKVSKENRAYMYKNDRKETAQHPSYRCYLNYKGEQLEVTLYTNVDENERIYYTGTVAENEQSED